MANTTGKKWGGRVKGTLNKKSQEFIDKYEVLSVKYCDPVEVLFSMAADEDMEKTVRRTAASDLLQYRFAKLKAVEHSGQVASKNTNELSDNELADIARNGSSRTTKKTTGKTQVH